MPPYVFFFKERTNAASITATTPQDLADAEIQRNVNQFGGFNSLDFKNNSVTAVDVFLDGSLDKRFRVAAGQGLNIDPRENIWYRNVTFQRVDAVTINAGEIRIQYQRTNFDEKPSVVV